MEPARNPRPAHPRLHPAAALEKTNGIDVDRNLNRTRCAKCGAGGGEKRVEIASLLFLEHDVVPMPPANQRQRRDGGTEDLHLVISDGGGGDPAAALRDDPASYREVAPCAAVTACGVGCVTRRKNEWAGGDTVRSYGENVDAERTVRSRTPHPAVRPPARSGKSATAAPDRPHRARIMTIERHAVAVTAAIWEIPVRSDPEPRAVVDLWREMQ